MYYKRCKCSRLVTDAVLARFVSFLVECECKWNGMESVDDASHLYAYRQLPTFQTTVCGTLSTMFYTCSRQTPGKERAVNHGLSDNVLVGEI
jgi:hypothetical protein